MQKISILGCGWLGFEAAQFFIKKGFEVKGSTTSESKLDALTQVGVNAFLLRITDEINIPNSYLENQEKNKVQVLDDFFATDILLLNIPPRRRNPNILEEHPKQIKAVVEEAKKRGLKHLIFISSTGVYGNENGIVTEETPLNPVRNSGKALQIVEQYLAQQKDIKITVLRMAGLVGGERKAGRFFAGKENVKGGLARVNMVHREDCIKVIDAVIEQNAWGETFNVCTDNHPTKKEFYTKQAFLQGFVPPTFDEDEMDADFKIVSNEKVKKVLGIEFGWGI